MARARVPTACAQTTHVSIKDGLHVDVQGLAEDVGRARDGLVGAEDGAARKQEGSVTGDGRPRVTTPRHPIPQSHHTRSTPRPRA